MDTARVLEAAPDVKATDAELEELCRTYRAPLPDVRTFLTDPFYFGDLVEPVGGQLEVLDQVFDPARPINEAGLACGIGWGKGTLVTCAIAYVTYRTLCLREPQVYYGLSPRTMLTFVNFSVTATQAHDVLFQDIATRIDSSPAFQQDGFQRDQRVRSRLVWPHRMMIMPGSSEARSALGRNVLGFVVDEASWFPRVQREATKDGRTVTGLADSVEVLWNAIRERQGSRGNWRWRRDALAFMISSPKSEGDFIETLNREQDRGIPGVYFKRSATWDGYPGRNLSGDVFHDEVCGKVPMEFRRDFEKDEERARRNLGGIPPKRFGGFFGSLEPIMAMFERDRVNVFETAEEAGEVVHRLREGAQRCCSAERFVHVDLSKSRDATGICCLHEHGDEVWVDGLIRMTADQFPEGEIQLERARDLILALKKAGYRVSASYDGWQSTDSLQLLAKKGVPATYVSCDRGTEAYDTAKSVVNGYRVKAPVCDILRQELEGLEYDSARGKVDHGPAGRGKVGSKDVSDAFAGALLNMVQNAGPAHFWQNW